MSKELKTAQKKELAKILYLQNQYLQKDIAAKVGVQECTISRWVTGEKWDLLRRSMVMTKDVLLGKLYMILEKLTIKIEESEDGTGDTKDGDKLIKYSATIKNLESETSVAQIIDVARMFVNYQLQINPTQAQITLNDFDAFVKEKLKIM
jgi:transcriptional regulator with XRE-family HTH domain